MSDRFARLVSESMARAGLGLRELCRRAELDPSFLSKVLAGKRNPPAEEDVLRRLAAALGADPIELVVAAGRVPSEWERLSEDHDLLARVHRDVTLNATSRSSPAFASEAKAEDVPERRSNWARSSKPEVPAPKSRPKLSDELL